MHTIKVLLVEDVKEQQEIFKSSVDVFNDKNKGIFNVEYVLAHDLSEAKNAIDATIDCAILDLKLDQDDDAGNKIVEHLNQSLTRFPVIFVTGHPELVVEHPRIFKIRARGDDSYENDLGLIGDIKKTGLIHIMGGRGVIEDTLNKVFINNILPQLTTWIEYGRKDPETTERGLLRHTLNHLLQLLEKDDDQSFAEEVYISPPLTKDIRTGSVVKERGQGTLLVVMSPICDLVVRKDGVCKTDRVLLAEIELEKSVVSPILEPITKKDKKSKAVEQLLSNNYSNYYHWLPKSKNFEGGFINFRKLKTLDPASFNATYGEPELQIAPPFLKDAVSRFASYYARQGQPDIHLAEFIERYVA